MLYFVRVLLTVFHHLANGIIEYFALLMFKGIVLRFKKRNFMLSLFLIRAVME